MSEVKMSEADKMFEKLGYIKDKEIDNLYCNVISPYKKQKDISFDEAKDFITITLTKYNEFGELESNTNVLSMNELQVINKKCEELGWI